MELGMFSWRTDGKNQADQMSFPLNLQRLFVCVCLEEGLNCSLFCPKRPRLDKSMNVSGKYIFDTLQQDAFGEIHVLPER